MLALENPNDSSFGAAIRPAVHDASQHPVPVHRIVEVVASDKQVALDFRNWRIGNQEAVAIAMSDDAAGDQVRVSCRMRPACRRFLGVRLRILLDWCWLSFCGCRRCAPRPSKPEPVA